MRPQLLMLPGMLCDHAVWDGLAAELSEVVDCSVVDYGCQDSLTGMARVACEMIKGPVAILGHSMGGRVALQVQRRVPSLVTHMGLFNTSASGHESAQSEERERASRRAQLNLARQEGLLGFARSWSNDVFAPQSRQDRGLIASFEAMVARQTMEIFEAHVAAGLGRPDMRSWLSGIACPTLVIGGELEKARPPETHMAIANAIPDATCEIIPGSAHMTIMEQPNVVARFLRTLMSLS
jgi:pimeloyl-ACP methyl ester carboxylesterase